MSEKEEELKSLLMRVKEGSEKAGLKLSIQKTKIMASGPITSWHIDREKVQTVTDLLFLSCKITADDDCSHEIKRYLLLGRKPMINLDIPLVSVVTGNLDFYPERKRHPSGFLPGWYQKRSIGESSLSLIWGSNEAIPTVSMRSRNEALLSLPVRGISWKPEFSQVFSSSSHTPHFPHPAALFFLHWCSGHRKPAERGDWNKIDILEM